MGTHLIYSTPSYGTSHLPTNVCFHLVFPLPFLYTSVHSVVHVDRCEATGNHTVDASIMEVLHFEFSLCIHCFFAIYPKLLNIFYSTLLPLFHRNNTHPPPLYFQTIPPWPVPRLRLSSRLVRRVVPERQLLLPELTSVRTMRSLLLLLSVRSDQLMSLLFLSLLRPILLLLLTCSQDVQLPVL